MFDNMQEAYHFYEDYAHLAGFGVRIRYQKKYKSTPTLDETAGDGDPMVLAVDPHVDTLGSFARTKAKEEKGRQTISGLDLMND